MANIMDQDTETGAKDKSAFNKVSRNLGRYAWAWLWPMTNKASFKEILGIYTFTIMANAFGSHFLPTLEDVAEKQNIKPEAIEVLDPYLDVKVQTNSFESQLHAATKLPGVVGFGFYMYKKHTTGAYAIRSFTPLDSILPDMTIKSLGGNCIINLEDALDTLETIRSDPSLDKKSDNNLKIAVTSILFHEVRHCAKDQSHGPYTEMDANYFAHKALKVQFNNEAGLLSDIVNAINYAENPDSNYDYFLYSDYKDRNLTLPAKKAIVSANVEANTYISKLIDSNKIRIFADSLPLSQVKTGPEEDAVTLIVEPPDSEDYSSLSELAQKRALYTLGLFKALRTDSELALKVTTDNRILMFPPKYKDRQHDGLQAISSQKTTGGYAICRYVI